LLKKKILLIGPFSAVGGVSIHIKRLSELLKNFFDFEFIDESPLKNKCKIEPYNIRSKNIGQYIKLVKNSDIIHIHTGVWWLRCVHIFSAFLLRKEIVVTIHSLSNLKNHFSILTTKIFLLLVDKTITVSDEVTKKITPKYKNIIPAFIPPVLEKEKELPLEVLEILEKSKENKIIVSNAFKLVEHNGEDLYGLDLIIDVARLIKEQNKRYKIIFIIASVTKNDKLYNHYCKLIKEDKLENIIYLIPYSISFVKLMQKSDLVIRATNTDGDALTVREAIYLDKPIIASNIAKRPIETILFQNRNSKDLFLKINQTLEQEDIKKNSESLINKNRKYYQDLYLSIYATNQKN